MMTNRRLSAAAIALAALAATAPAALAVGPKPSSENIIRQDAGVAAMPVVPSATMIGPKASSENYIAPQPSARVAGQPHYVWQEGYEGPGKWRGHWVLVP